MNSSSRIARRFAARSAAGRTTLIPSVTAGFPEMATTGPLLRALDDAGADIIELGIPFSDPLADGPTIQASSFRALENGVTVEGVLEMVREFRTDRETPIVLFTYLNPVFHYGLERFCADATAAGADGILLTDLPAGCDPELEGTLERAGLDLIRLLAPTTAPERVARVAEGGRGFLYYISRAGVTGAQQALRAELADEVDRLRERVGLPVAVGFGISSPEQAREVAGVADGVVVGSALIHRLDAGGIEAAAAFVASLRKAMDGTAAPV